MQVSFWRSFFSAPLEFKSNASNCFADCLWMELLSEDISGYWFIESMQWKGCVCWCIANSIIALIRTLPRVYFHYCMEACDRYFNCESDIASWYQILFWYLWRALTIVRLTARVSIRKNASRKVNQCYEPGFFMGSCEELSQFIVVRLQSTLRKMYRVSSRIVKSVWKPEITEHALYTYWSKRWMSARQLRWLILKPIYQQTQYFHFRFRS